MSKKKGSADQRRRVYIHFRALISGLDSQEVRKQKRVKELVDASWWSLGPLLQDIGQKQVSRILQSMRDSRLFESEAIAKREFPELFLPSPPLDVQREAAEDRAAKSREEILDSINFLHDEGLDMDDAPDSEPDEPDEREEPEEPKEPEKQLEIVDLVNGENQVENPAGT
ncbi:hypothetical protein NEMBOFW57_000129 [Staphylotrichum longicolle]|uniref:Uncharacterized protein n=1 Tax=Staphylotrichum longicolle TaxID=669026 RepID=A0AAD4HZJ9_9PEZI|nr:hypothetical protein NEMBOFW57_000129 [Staphylotrichum longicolle]